MQGVGVSTFNPKKKLYPLVSGVDVAQSSETKENARYDHFVPQLSRITSKTNLKKQRYS